MGIWRIWELQLDRRQTQQDAVDVHSDVGGKVLKLEREKSLIFSMSLQRMLSVNGKQGGKQPVFHSHSLPREAFRGKYSRPVRERQPFLHHQIEVCSASYNIHH